MRTANHGGQCCGASHVFDLGSSAANIPALMQAIESLLKSRERSTASAWDTFGYQGYREGGGGWIDGAVKGEYRWKDRGYNHLIEITLTDLQMKYLAKELKAMGFQLHRRWLNDNTGNYCNLLSYCPVEVEGTPPPYEW